MPETVVDPLVERVKKLAMTMQFAWFVGHLVTVTQAILTIFSSGSWNYYKAYYGTLLSYGIILWKAHKSTFQLNMQFAARLLQDENFQYFLIAVVWVTAVPIRVTLIPFATFSLFHSIGYIRTELIPKVFPGSEQGIWVSSLLSTVMTKYQPISINAVARAEIWIIFPMTIVSIFWGGASVFIPFLYFQFIQFRYIASPATRVALQETEVVLDKIFLGITSLPPSIKTGYSKAKEMVKKYGDLEARARQSTAPNTAN